MHYTRKRQAIAPNCLLLTQVLRTRRTIQRAQQGTISNYISPRILASICRKLFRPYNLYRLQESGTFYYYKGLELTISKIVRNARTVQI